MIRFPRVRYCLEAPSLADTSDAGVPVFLAPPKLRPGLTLLVPQAVASVTTVIDVRRAGADLRSVLRFLLWLDTARCFGIETIEQTDEITAALGEHLPASPPWAADARPTVTGVIIAKNEEDALPGALRSLVPLVDELVVVDDHSTDATAEIARDLGARVLTRGLGANFAEQKNAGIEAAGTEWVVCIDADERLEPSFAPFLRQVMGWPRCDAIFVPILNFVTAPGEEPTLVHWPAVQARVFRSRLRYRGAVHEWVDGWRRPLFTPLSGPYIRHEKSRLSQHRSTLLYDAIDPSRYSRDEIESVKEELARMEDAPPRHRS